MNPKKKHNIVQREHKIYGKTFLIPLINFLVASSCWYFLISAHFHAYKTRHVKCGMREDTLFSLFLFSIN